jgi:DNA-binding transcriptional regulator GbsR (MarR family)
MNNNDILTFTDLIGQFYTSKYGFSPMVGRVLGYLAISDPIQQSIADLAKALLASRSAITGAVKVLEHFGMVRRTRSAGERVDLICINTSGLEVNGFNAEEYKEQAMLAREGLELLKNASPERRAALEEIAAFAEFLAERMPALLEEWHVYRATLQGLKKGG